MGSGFERNKLFASRSEFITTDGAGVVWVVATMRSAGIMFQAYRNRRLALRYCPCSGLCYDHLMAQKLRRWLIIGVTAVVLAACGGPTLSGKYRGTALIADIEMEFSGNKVYVTSMGVIKEGTYTMEGDKVKILVEGETTIMRLTPEGHLAGLPFDAVLKKVP